MKEDSGLEKLEQIVDLLLLNGTIVENIGLIHGKTGIAIFFFHYADLSKNELFEDYAMDLISEIKKQIHVSSPAYYEDGVAGIGVGFDYLLRRKFLQVGEHFFEDFDKRMYRAVMYDPWQDFSLYDGLSGYGKYWLMRLQQSLSNIQARECLLHVVSLIKERKNDIPIHEQSDTYCFLHDLHQMQGFQIDNELFEMFLPPTMDVSHCFPRLGDSEIGNATRTYQHAHYILSEDMRQVPNFDMAKPTAGIGFLNGFVGEGMMLLSVLESQNMSWMHLL